MIKSAACIISGMGLILSAFFSPAYSATIEKGGIIHFRGAIVADPCDVTPQQHRQLSISCPDNNHINTQTISYDEALSGHQSRSNLAAVTMKYLNEQKTLAVVQVDYR
ncbi:MULTISPECIES: type 1 fimbrial protein [Enterobacter]|uniref:Type 1 fimbrial protein n=2 Tax=Enterobacter cloacae complex TaxID=354276 RepID=A0A7H8UIE1_ENTCL|nr:MULTISPECIES: type 1 fimbrial protein [Enterobacter]MCM7511537.1 type 1 fimbrial protein [Enterobacter hormaechei]MBE4852648.1 type 1 fimbrial protein [Enterobacter pasteurii]MBE4862125.1 type 1 fimbrial protein [Enterobacter cloacae complex sp. P40C2]MBE4878085.1 type 1 fimbrial protein [Enterobacter cloacae complex sp. P40C]MCI2293631.1 type 1 fimbrial protein [Enterobacter sp. I4]